MMAATGECPQQASTDAHETDDETLAFLRSSPSVGSVCELEDDGVAAASAIKHRTIGRKRVLGAGICLVGLGSIAVGFFLVSHPPPINRREIYPSKAGSDMLAPNTVAATQISNYHKNLSLIVNVHITHHAGTTVCSRLGRAGPSPVHWCSANATQQGKIPWTKNETGTRLQSLREDFHLVAWEFGPVHNDRPLARTHWEHPMLVSILVMRDPISRLLAGDGIVNREYGPAETRTVEQWWAFANDDRFTNNFALQRLAGNGCCDGERTDVSHLANAKELVGRFTYVLDIACLDDGLEALAEELGQKLIKQPRKGHHGGHTIKNETLLEYLVQRNLLDIELYEWSKKRSLVDCSARKKTSLAPLK